MKKMRYILFSIVSVTILVTGCKDLDIENLNNPDSERTMGSSEDVEGVAGSLIAGWFRSCHAYDGPGLALWTMSDVGTCSWANAGMNDLSSEPREEFNNTPSYAYADIIREFWSSQYSTLSLANDVLTAVRTNGIEIGEDGEDTPRTEAVAKLVQGMTLGYLGLIFDKGYVVDENTDLTADFDEPVSYTELIIAAIASLEEAIEIADENSFTFSEDWINGETYSNKQVAALARSFIVRFMVYGCRNKADNDALDWSEVLTYSQNGITKNFAPEGDGQEPWQATCVWGSEYQTYAIYDGWAQIDMRVIHMLDPDIPDTWSESGNYSDVTNLGVATSDDARLEADFSYVASCGFKAERGYYHFSSYRYARLDDYLSDFAQPMPEMYRTENDLFEAEALARTGNLPDAIEIINEGTRVTRGELDTIASDATLDEILEAIFYERTIELTLSGMGIQFFDMRRRDMLQTGTLLHFPIPAQQLDIIGMDYYTFGGEENADGINTSDGGWE